MRLFLAAVALSTALGAPAARASVDACQDLSGPLLTPAPRFVFSMRDPAGAVGACRLALDAAPGDGVTALLLARARIALNPEDGEVLALLVQAREGQMALADWMIGQAYEFGFAGLPLNERQARDVYRTVCGALWPDAVAAPACTALASMRVEGRGGPAELPEGLAMLEQLCETGHAPACLEAALQHEFRGAGDVETVAALYAMGCEAGDALACSHYGFHLETGEGVPADIDTARALYDLSCDAGEPHGCTNLGEVYRLGLGVDADMARAIGLFETGCAGHEAYACVALGEIHEAGLDTARDVARARRYFDAACMMGDPEGCDRADALR